MSLRTLHHPNILELLQVELDALYVKKNGTRVGREGGREGGRGGEGGEYRNRARTTAGL